MGKLIDVIKQFWIPDPVEEISEKEIDEKMSKEMEKTNKRIQKLEKDLNLEHIKVATKSPRIKKTTINSEQKNKGEEKIAENSNKQKEQINDNELTI